MFKLQLVILIIASKVLGQVVGLQFDYAAVEITNCIFPIVKSSNGVDWVTCGVIVPIPAQPRDSWCLYKVGADWNTNLPVWITRTNIIYIYRTNTLAQIPKTVFMTQSVTKYKLITNKTTSAKSSKLVTQSTVYKQLPSPPSK